MRKKSKQLNQKTNEKIILLNYFVNRHVDMNENDDEMGRERKETKPIGNNNSNINSETIQQYVDITI